MATRFAIVTEEEIKQIKQDSIPQKTKVATKYGVKVFQGKIFNFTCFCLNKNSLFAPAKRCSHFPAAIIVAHKQSKYNKHKNSNFNRMVSRAK